jgi:hypothetical protein
MMLTEFHYVLLYADRLVAVSRLSERVVHVHRLAASPSSSSSSSSSSLSSSSSAALIADMPVALAADAAAASAWMYSSAFVFVGGATALMRFR